MHKETPGRSERGGAEPRGAFGKSNQTDSLPTLPSLSKAKSICLSVWVAIRLMRMSSSPGGTAGETTGLTKTPSSCNRLQILNATIKSRQ